LEIHWSRVRAPSAPRQPNSDGIFRRFPKSTLMARSRRSATCVCLAVGFESAAGVGYSARTGPSTRNTIGSSPNSSSIFVRHPGRRRTRALRPRLPTRLNPPRRQRHPPSWRRHLPQRPAALVDLIADGGFWQSSQHVPSRAESLVRVERSGVGSVAGAGTGRHAHASRALRVPAGPACGRPLTRGTLRPWGRVAGRAMALPASSARRLMSRGVVSDQRGEPTRRTGGRSPRWVCGSRGVFGAGR